ncbi:MAG: N-acetyltransferase family protein [Thiotrichales bacterium]
MEFNIVEIELNNPEHASALVGLLNAYAQDEMGGGATLDENVRRNLVPALQQRIDYLGLLVECDGRFLGLLNAFEGFSTFYARPLLNIHDIYIQPEFRGMKLAGSLLNAAEKISQARGYCKLTLEVLSNNEAAKSSYRKAGFSPYELKKVHGRAEFWEKRI